MMSTKTAWRASAQRPCPVCCCPSKGCSANGDDSFFCRGARGDVPQGWLRVHQGEEFDTFRRVGDSRHQANGAAAVGPQHPTQPMTDWSRLVRQFAANLTEERRAALAANLGLPLVAIDGLRDIGFNPDERLGPCWTFPERNPHGTPTGINRRWPEPVLIAEEWKNKAVMKGAARGLYFGAGWDSSSGPLLIPEGASDVLSLALCELPALGRPSAASGAALLAETLRDAPADRQLIVIGENDQKQNGEWPGRAGAVSIANKLSNALGRPVRLSLPPTGIKDVRVWVCKISDEVKSAPDWRLIGQEILEALVDAAEWVEPEQNLVAVSSELAPVPLQEVFKDTDVANGRRFVREFGNDVRFVADWGGWVVFDGRRWAVDKKQTLVEARAKITTDRMSDEAVRAVAEAARALLKAQTDTEKESAKAQRADAERALAHAKKSQDIRAVRRMLESARSEPQVCLQVGREVFDRHPDLLNCANGTVELRTGKLREHRREDYLTRVTPIAYNPVAPRRGYIDFLNKIFRNSPNLREYIRKLSGYVATGEVCVHVFNVFHGEGSNGKTLLLNAWGAALGEYTYKAPSELLVNDGRERHPTEKVGLQGAHLVICQETREGGQLDEAKVKSLTGGDPIEARGMGQNYFTFDPSHKLILSTNHKPRLRGTDDGIRRRLRLVPFTTRFWTEADRALNPNATFDEELRADPELTDRLLGSELEGILADMVERAEQFYASGLTLTPPREVADATREYITAEDVIAQFFDAMVVADPNGRIGGAEFIELFKRWAVAEGHDERRLPSSKKFGVEAKKRFLSLKCGTTTYRVRVSDLPS
jgi:putative DNA primase/helicase